jgi:hypothetical protein
MGNIMSEEEAEKEFLGEDFDFESPEADKQINYGTAAPMCQPKHTLEELKLDASGAASGWTEPSHAAHSETSTRLWPFGIERLQGRQETKCGCATAAKETLLHPDGKTRLSGTYQCYYSTSSCGLQDGIIRPSCVQLLREAFHTYGLYPSDQKGLQP